MKAIDQFKTGLEHNRTGLGGVAVSVCSAHPDVLRATFRTAIKYETFALIESTSNQVDQYGGYTGMRQGEGVRRGQRPAEEGRFAEEGIVLGGDTGG